MRYLLLSLFVLSACSSAELPKNIPPSERDPVTVEAKFAGSEVGAQQIAEFRFPKGSALLPREAQARIGNAFDKAGPLSEIKILAWPDRESAPVKGDSLPKNDQELAAKRIEAVGKAIAPRAKRVKVRTHNMATSTGPLDRLLGTSEYRVKDSLQASGVATDQKEGTKMAGKALVLLVPAEKKKP
jgi:hypothetical protein